MRRSVGVSETATQRKRKSRGVWMRDCSYPCHSSCQPILFLMLSSMLLVCIPFLSSLLPHSFLLSLSSSPTPVRPRGAKTRALHRDQTQVNARRSDTISACMYECTHKRRNKSGIDVRRDNRTKNVKIKYSPHTLPPRPRPPLGPF